MNEKELLQGVAETLTEKPKAEITIEAKNPRWYDWLLRRPKKRLFVIKPTVVASMIDLSGMAGLMDSGLMEAATSQKGNRVPAILAAINANLKDVVVAVAIIIQNNGERPDPKLVRWLTKNTDAFDLADIIVPVLGSTYMQAFLNSIVLVKGTENVLKPKTSLEEPGEMIASGV